MYFYDIRVNKVFGLKDVENLDEIYSKINDFMDDKLQLSQLYFRLLPKIKNIFNEFQKQLPKKIPFLSDLYKKVFRDADHFIKDNIITPDAKYSPRLTVNYYINEYGDGKQYNIDKLKQNTKELKWCYNYIFDMYCLKSLLKSSKTNRIYVMGNAHAERTSSVLDKEKHLKTLHIYKSKIVDINPYGYIDSEDSKRYKNIPLNKNSILYKIFKK